MKVGDRVRRRAEPIDADLGQVYVGSTATVTGVAARRNYIQVRWDRPSYWKTDSTFFDSDLFEVIPVSICAECGQSMEAVDYLCDECRHAMR